MTIPSQKHEKNTSNTTVNRDELPQLLQCKLNSTTPEIFLTDVVNERDISVFSLVDQVLSTLVDVGCSCEEKSTSFRAPSNVNELVRRSNDISYLEEELNDQVKNFLISPDFSSKIDEFNQIHEWVKHHTARLQFCLEALSEMRAKSLFPEGNVQDGTESFASRSTTLNFYKSEILKQAIDRMKELQSLRIAGKPQGTSNFPHWEVETFSPAQGTGDNFSLDAIEGNYKNMFGAPLLVGDGDSWIEDCFGEIVDSVDMNREQSFNGHELMVEDAQMNRFLISAVPFNRDTSGSSQSSQSDIDRRAKRFKIPNSAKFLLNEWLASHWHHPYPTDNEKAQLAELTGLTLPQLNNWFVNTRVRKWKPVAHEPYPQHYLHTGV